MARKSESQPTMYAWDEETSVLVDWFFETVLPEEPFRFRRGVEVAQPGKFCEVLKNDISQGVEGARARTGALQEDLRCLFDMFGRK